MLIPLHHTDRLRLEPLSHAHSAGMFELWSSPEVCRFSGSAKGIDGVTIPLPVQGASDSDRIIGFLEAMAARERAMRWAVLLQPEHAFVGALGFNAFGDCPEIALHLHPAFWGRGLMTEAARAALGWLADGTAARSAQAFADPANTASVRLLRRLGFNRSGESRDGAQRYVLQLGAGG